MSALLEYRCARHPSGYRIVAFDQRKVRDWFPFESKAAELTSGATEDEKQVLARWGNHLSPSGEQPGIIHLLEPKSPEIEHYDLFEHAPGMFMEFAKTPTTLAGVKSFADRYGSRHAGHFNLIEDEYQDIREIRRAVNDWEKAQKTGDFARLIRIVSRRVVYRGSERWESDEGLSANIMLTEVASRGNARLSIRPPDFTEAIWTQFILAVDGNLNFQTCFECQTWFPIASAGHRSDKRYCSDACRMRAYRKRKPKKRGG